jgi:four helix bundle protein
MLAIGQFYNSAIAVSSNRSRSKMVKQFLICNNKPSCVMAADNFRNLTVYKKAFALAMKVFDTTTTFPKDEKYSLTDQIRRSSRSVCSCIGEAYRKRHYEGYFVNNTVAQLQNCPIENIKNMVGCNYITRLSGINGSQTLELEKLLNHMIETRKNIWDPQT